jgi:N utilization substance protein B
MRIPPRRRARELALQGLYQWQMNHATPAELMQNLSELEHFEGADQALLGTLLNGAMREHDALRARLEPFADRKWAEVSPVERSILLIGAWELLHTLDTPYRVVINESIELAKRFGGTDGHRWVNGVLDKLAAQARPDEFNAKKKTA